jgi:hypothetical protein
MRNRLGGSGFFFRRATRSPLDQRAVQFQAKRRDPEGPRALAFVALFERAEDYSSFTALSALGDGGGICGCGGT